MEIKIFLSLFILPAILSLWTFAEGNIESSKLLLRKKRVIDRTPFGNKPQIIQNVRHIVNVLRNGASVCAGSILKHHFILTAAHCIMKNTDTYSVLSGSPYVDRGNHHNVTKIIKYSPASLQSDLALLIIFPSIDLNHSPNRPIALYQGNLPPNIIGFFSGWGCEPELRMSSQRPKELRTITVPIMSHDACFEFYKNYTRITDRMFCTFDGQKSSGFGDAGGPLVIHNQLAGVFAWRGLLSKRENPDVFMNLGHSVYRSWIYSTMHFIN